jgi:hypothetical protein
MAAWNDPVVILSGTALLLSGLNTIGTWMLGNHDAVRDISRLHTENTTRKEENNDIKRMIERANEEWSKKYSATTIHLGEIDVTLSSVKTELLLMRGYRREGEGV